MAADGRLERYCLNAEKCLGLAQRFNDQQRKWIMLGMANAWLTLAEQYLKNSESPSIDKTPTPRPNANPRDDPE